jgi:hypothetical protein
MTEPKPPLARLTERIAETAKDFIDESAAAMSAESKKIDAGKNAVKDEDKYQMKDAIATATKVVGAGITGAAHIGRIVIEEKPPDTVLAMGEYIASVVRRMVTQTGTVAADASAHVEKKDYTPTKWLESMTRMIDIGVAGGMEIVETVIAGPARFEVQPIRSDEFEAPAIPPGETRTLVADLLKRDATDSAIPMSRISFEPPVLDSTVTKFRVVVDASGLASGVYEGKVNSVRSGPPPTLESIEVSIAL